MFFRPGFDEDAIVFERASSNGIPIALNITLYAYVILEYYFKQNRNRDLLIIAFINMSLIFIQQSRAGIFCSILLLFIIIYSNYREYFKRFLLTLGFFTTIIAVNTNFFNFVYLATGFRMNYEDDNRSASVLDFFKMVLENDFFWGAPLNVSFGEASYTFNVFLDFWNNYSFLGFIIIVSFIFYRLLNKKKYYFPVYFFLPFLFYSMFESIFFPDYWDVIIYLLIFVKAKPEFYNQSDSKPSYNLKSN